jgi:hypothetical protein
MLRIVKLGLAASLTGLLIALAASGPSSRGHSRPTATSATYRDVQPVLVGCVVEAALAHNIYGVVRGARPLKGGAQSSASRWAVPPAPTLAISRGCARSRAAHASSVRSVVTDTSERPPWTSCW